jgi:hypothetical protein
VGEAQACGKHTEPIITLHPERPVALAICVWNQNTPDDFQEVWFQSDCPDRTTLREDLHGSGLVLAQPVTFPIAAGSRVRFWRRD